MRIIKAAALVLLLSLELSCAVWTRVEGLTLRDAESALARAERGKDAAGSMCWRFVVERIKSDDLTLDLVGIMDTIEAARIVRLQAPGLRAAVTQNCGEVFADVMVEIGKRARR